MQKEIQQLMSNDFVRKIVHSVKDTGYFAVIADESTDISGDQQLTVSLRWIDITIHVHEDFIGVYEMTGADASRLSLRQCVIIGLLL